MTARAHVVTLVPIREMDRALRFYTRTLGARMIARGDGEMRDSWAAVRLLGAELWLVTPLRREQRRLAYTTLIVPRIKPFVRGLLRKGVKFRRAERISPATKLDGPIASESFGASAFFYDSERNLWMVWQNGL